MAWMVVLGWFVVLPGLVALDWYLSFPFWDGLATINVLWSISLYFWCSGSLALASKVPLVERLLPLDLRTRMHRFTGMAVVAGLVWHVAAKFLGAMEIDTLSWVLLWLCALMVVLALFWTPLPGFRWLRSRMGGSLTRRADRAWDLLRVAHSLGFAALVALSWWHIHSAGIDTMGVSGLVWAYPVAAVCSLALWAWSWLGLLWGPRGRVESVEQRGAMVLIRVRLDKAHSWKAGQFTHLRFPGRRGLGFRHPFSFLDAPGPGGRSTVASFAVKAAGDFTSGMREVVPGDRVHLGPVFGSFGPGASTPAGKARAGQEPGASKPPVLLIGTGIGTVPVLSLLQTWQAMAGGPGFPAHAVLAVDSSAALPVPESSIDPEALVPPDGRHVKGLKVDLLVHDRDGRLVDKAMLAGILAAAGPSAASEVADSAPGTRIAPVAASPGRHWRVYLCTSPGLRRVFTRWLRELGVPAGAIHHESFGA